MSEGPAKLAEIKASIIKQQAERIKSEQLGAGILSDGERDKVNALLDLRVAEAEAHAKLLRDTPLSAESPEMLAKLRIFRSRVHGSTFFFAEGTCAVFTNGWYETSDASEIKQLDLVANKTPTIYTDEKEKEIIQAVVEARKAGFSGTIGEAMTQQLTVEDRIRALTHSRVNPQTALPGGQILNLPTDMPIGVTGAEVARAESSLRQAIKQASSSSNS